MDVDMTPGVDFVERITEAVAACQVLIVVMGPRWATVENEQGTARIADPDDFVRLEVETALRRPEVTPIPVLVSGARMPSREVLPPEVQAITRRNALELSDSRWRYDIGRLLSTLDELLAQTPLVDRPSPERRVGAETAAPTDTAQPSGETAPPSAPPDAATAPGETKRTARLWGGGRRRWLLLAAIAIAAILVAVVVAALLSDPGPEGEFRGTELSELVLDTAPPGLLRDGSGAGYPPDALQGLPSPKGAFYREFTQEDQNAMPYRVLRVGRRGLQGRGRCPRCTRPHEKDLSGIEYPTENGLGPRRPGPCYPGHGGGATAILFRLANRGAPAVLQPRLGPRASGRSDCSRLR